MLPLFGETPGRHGAIDAECEDIRILQYKALRDEILHLRRSGTQVLTLGIAGIPALVGTAKSSDLDLVVCAAPLVVVAFMLLLLCEQNSLMRIGNYVRLHLEPSLNKERLVEITWEDYLERDMDLRRHAEGFFAAAFYGIYAFYYLAGSYLACLTLSEILLGLKTGAERPGIFGHLAWSEGLLVVAGGVYLLIFVASMYILVRYFPTRSSRNGEGQVGSAGGQRELLTANP